MGLKIQLTYASLLVCLGPLFLMVLVSSCPTDTDSCCECVAHAGCSWYHDPSQGPPVCSDSPFLGTTRNTSNDDFVMPSEKVRVQIPGSKNRPINLNRQRIIRPQGANLWLAVGLQHDLPIEILSRSRRLELLLIGPSQYLEFRLEPEDSTSCMDGFDRVGRRGNTARGRPGSQPGHRMTRSAAAGLRRNRGGAGRSGRGNRRSVKRERFECLSSAPGLINKFRLVISMDSCMASKKIIKVIVKDQGVTKKLRVHVESLCTCPCEASSGPTDDMSDQCESGKMTCPNQPGSLYNGDDCAGSSLRCASQNGGQACSGHGTCICGYCMCHEIRGSSNQRYSGQFCECNDYECPYNDGLICNGPDKGMCACGRCVCRPGFQGDACQYDLSMPSVCQESESPDDEVCNGNGICVNGLCQCEPPYAGVLCQDCPTCIRPSMCIQMKSCVVCVLFPDPATTTLCNQRCGIMTLESFRAVDTLTDTMGNMCMYRHTNGCLFQFSYNFEGIVYYQTTTHCPQPEDTI